MTTTNKDTNNTKKRKKHDEFFTRYEYIEKELLPYGLAGHFRGKKILLPSDISFSNELDSFDKLKSNFSKYLEKNKYRFGIESITTSIWDALISDEENISRGNKRFQDINFDDFDIVITNPPGSQTNELFEKLISSNNKFIIAIDVSKVIIKSLFPLIKNKFAWISHSESGMKMDTIDMDENGSKIINNETQGKIVWITNIGNIPPSIWDGVSGVKYNGNEDEFEFSDDGKSLRVKEAKQIPDDYFGLVSVPITMMTDFNYEKFEIFGVSEPFDKGIVFFKGNKEWTRLFVRRKID